MGVIVFSDIHGNYDNLSRFHDGLRGFNYSRAYCLGDIIHNGQTYDENRVINLLREMGAVCIKGNHDMRKDAPKILPTNKEFLQNLEARTEVGDILFTHIPVSGDKRLISSKDYLGEAEAIAKQYPHIGFAFEGHNHAARIYNFQNQRLIELDASKKQPLRNGLYLISPGGL
ncbi:metallophosphoesterase, partial [Candidatus Woesearchaeota archaeon]|nr:metallophosphoesterase [Candidatus Woesearchaeota archaeon]